MAEVGFYHLGNTALERALKADIHAPVRVNHRIDVPGLPPGSLLLMPAWQVGDKIGVKLVTVMPGKGSQSVYWPWLPANGLVSATRSFTASC